jgi:hypothetical protein
MANKTPPELRPMSEFDPSEPAVLHDATNDKMIAWTGELAAEWQKWASPFEEGVMNWDGVLIDGWTEPLGG